MPSEITDPALLSQLNAGPQEITDPNVLSALNAPPESAPSRDFIPQPATYQPGSFWQNAMAGARKLYSDAALGGAQLYARALEPDILPQLQTMAAKQRTADAPLMRTWGGKVGMVGGAAPIAFIPGANTYTGAALTGALMSGVQPTVEGESPLAHAAIGGALGLAGKGISDTLSGWLTSRAAQPFKGWGLKSGNQAAAEAVGSDAEALTQPALADTAARFSDIFGRARSPDVNVEMTGATSKAIDAAASDLGNSANSALRGNRAISDLLGLQPGSNVTAEQLGNISSQLGREAANQMTSDAGDRTLGQALFSVKDHVDDLIGNSITDPTLQAAYTAARPQYRTFLTLTQHPTILNSTTGDVNLRNLGNYLQKTDKGFLYGSNTSPLYEAARWGQATRLGSSPPSLFTPAKWALYHAINNPVVGATTGAVSRVGAPLAPLIRGGLPGLNVASEPISLPYLTE